MDAGDEEWEDRRRLGDRMIGLSETELRSVPALVQSGRRAGVETPECVRESHVLHVSLYLLLGTPLVV